MRRTVYIVIFLFLKLVIKAQTEKKDSLLKLLPSKNEDTGKVMLLLKIADSYETSNQDSSIYYLEKSKRLSDALEFKTGIYQYYNQSAIVSFTKGDYDLSMQQSNKALDVARDLGDSGLIINMLNNTGIVYQYLGQYDKQLEYSLQALSIAEKANRKEKLVSMYHNVANAYYNLKQYRRAAEYCLTAIKLHQQKRSNAYVNRIYATLGQSYASMQMTDSALYYYQIGAKESAGVNDIYAEAAIYGYMVNACADKGDFKAMLNAAEKSLQLSKTLQSNQMLASSLYNIANAAYFNGNNISARKYIDEALVIAVKDSLKDELKNIYTILSYITAGEGNFKTSLWAKRQSDSIQETVLNEQVIKTTTELGKKYETEKKDHQIKLQQAELKNRKVLNYYLFGAAFGILFISLLMYRYYHQKRKLQQQRISQLEKEKQLTATEAVLKGEEQERTRMAKDLHDGLGGMLSGIKYSLNTMKTNLIMTPDNLQAFERSMDMLDSSIKEMRRVAHNMMPEALVKFGLDTALKDFCNDINQSGVLKVQYQSIGLENTIIDQLTAITIYRIVQELLNNTIKHAAATNVIVQVSNTNSLLLVTVEDDGKGFDTSLLKQTRGIGWSNIQNRVEFLQGKLDIHSEPGKGTSVLIELNL